ncbi:MAG: hypothetical protein H0T53_03320 [Herpetosiphonaceae bacterium]|nr:hypothetical protein [Herpetosiphonaceae bacterium]
MAGVNPSRTSINILLVRTVNVVAIGMSFVILWPALDVNPIYALPAMIGPILVLKLEHRIEAASGRRRSLYFAVQIGVLIGLILTGLALNYSSLHIFGWLGGFALLGLIDAGFRVRRIAALEEKRLDNISE